MQTNTLNITNTLNTLNKSSQYAFIILNKKNNLNQKNNLKKIQEIFLKQSTSTSTSILNNYDLLTLNTPANIYKTLDIPQHYQLLVLEPKNLENIKNIENSEINIFFENLKTENILYEMVDLEKAAILKNLDLMIFDMDSTLINMECIDEMAKAHGCFDAVANITKQAMLGELDFTQSLNARLALLKNAPIDILNTVLENLTFMQGVEDFFKYIKYNNENLKNIENDEDDEDIYHQASHIQTILASGGFDFFAKHVQNILGLDAIHAHQLEINYAQKTLSGKIIGDIIDANAKQNILKAYQSNEHKKCSVAVGDGANDSLMLQAANFGVAMHAKPALKQYADLEINHFGLDILIVLHQYAIHQGTCQLKVENITNIKNI